MAYEGLMQKANPKDVNGQRQPVKLSNAVGFGAVAGVAMWVFCFPFDVVKTKLQTDNLASPKFRGTMDATREIFMESGLKGFTKGMAPCIMRSVPVNMATFAGFEFVMKLLRKMD